MIYMRNGVPSLDCIPTINNRLIHCGMRARIETMRKTREYCQLYKRVLFIRYSVDCTGVDDLSTHLGENTSMACAISRRKMMQLSVKTSENTALDIVECRSFWSACTRRLAVLFTGVVAGEGSIPSSTESVWACLDCCLPLGEAWRDRLAKSGYKLFDRYFRHMEKRVILNDS